MAVDQLYADALAEIEKLRRELDHWRDERNNLARTCADLLDELDTLRGATGGPVAVALVLLAENLAGVAELAAELGVSKQAVCNWQRRNEDFPAALTDLKGGPVYDQRQVRALA